jgi:hypothetical protein
MHQTTYALGKKQQACAYLHYTTIQYHEKWSLNRVESDAQSCSALSASS